MVIILKALNREQIDEIINVSNDKRFGTPGTALQQLLNARGVNKEIPEEDKRLIYAKMQAKGYSSPPMPTRLRTSNSEDQGEWPFPRNFAQHPLYRNGDQNSEDLGNSFDDASRPQLFRSATDDHLHQSYAMNDERNEPTAPPLSGIVEAEKRHPATTDEPDRKPLESIGSLNEASGYPGSSYYIPLYKETDTVYLKGPRGVDPLPYQIHQVLDDGRYKLSRDGKSDGKIYFEEDLYPRH